jgi:GNAT superfamily N-acetyltransferase
MKQYSHEDPDLEPYKEAISAYDKAYKAAGAPYWVFFEKKNPIGIVAVGKEPVRLLRPIGTPVSLIHILDYDIPSEAMCELASGMSKLFKDQEVDYAFVDIPAQHSELASCFTEHGFEEVAVSLRMALDLDGDFQQTSTLRFDKVNRDDVHQFIDHMREHMSGSPDTVLEMARENLRNLPVEFLHKWYESEALFIAYENNESVGVLNLSKGGLNISNMGVAEAHRGKGYGRQILMYGLKWLKDEGYELARLRVHRDNKPAISLYESLGFKETSQYRALIWWREKQSS